MSGRLAGQIFDVLSNTLLMICDDLDINKVPIC